MALLLSKGGFEDGVVDLLEVLPCGVGLVALVERAECRRNRLTGG